MDKRGQMLIEILLTVILVTLLIILIFLFTSPSITGKSSTTSSTNPKITITQHITYQTPTRYYEPIKTSYKTRDYHYLYDDRKPVKHRIRKHYRGYPRYYKYHKDYSKYYDKDYHYLRYSDRAEHKKLNGMFGNEVNRYTVYVKNRDYKGGYFTVKFYFSDYYGETRTESIRHYIKPKEERKFFYQSIYSDKYEYYDWDYEVISETKSP